MSESIMEDETDSSSGQEGERMEPKVAHALLDDAAAKGILDEGKSPDELESILGISSSRIKAYKSKKENTFGYRFCRNRQYKDNGTPWTKEEEEQLVNYAIQTKCQGPWNDKIVNGRVGYIAQGHLKNVVPIRSRADDNTNDDVSQNLYYDEDKGCYVVNGVPSEPKRKRKSEKQSTTTTTTGKKVKRVKTSSSVATRKNKNNKPTMMWMNNATIASYASEVAPSIHSMDTWFKFWMDLPTSNVVQQQQSSSSSSSSSAQHNQQQVHIMVNASLPPIDFGRVRHALAVIKEFDQMMMGGQATTMHDA
jgi:hypothetical protein